MKILSHDPITYDSCRRGDFNGCERDEITGLTFDSGYAKYAMVLAEAIGRIPEELAAVNVAPLLCAGITTFNALRNENANPGDPVAVYGVGGLGHLEIQYAHAMGFETVALSWSADKEEPVLNLGTDHFVDTSETDGGEALQSLDGVRLVLLTVPVADAITDAADGIGREGSLVAVGIPDETIGVDIRHLVDTCGSVAGWFSGHAKDREDTLEFSALCEVRPIIETYPLSEVEEAYDRMMANDGWFRAVLEP